MPPAINAPSQPATPSVPADIKPAVFMPDLANRRSLMEFLDLSYEGGAAYKHGNDSSGLPILIAHESEVLTSLPEMLAAAGGTNPVAGKLERRRRAAVYENLVKPIVDKFCAYLTRTPPKRNERVAKEAQRLKLDMVIRATVEDSLKHTEAWVGFDAAAIPVESDVTEAEAKQIDPKNQGRPYLVRRDARLVVDIEEGEDGTIERVVFEEEHCEKGSLTTAAVHSTRYREWTANEWVLYEAVAEQDAGNGLKMYVPTLVPAGVGAVTVKEIDRGNHTFKACPWVRLRPRFPIEDIAELNRSLFNIDSLLDEEVYKNTFTQKYATGVRSTTLDTMLSGPGNFMAFPDPEVKLGVLGSIEGQSQVLMARLDDRRRSIYGIVSMESSRDKNVAEAAEKKKRDMESLYAMLVKITEAVEETENRLLVAMGLADKDKPETFSNYDRKFDVTSLADFLTELEKVLKLPYLPASAKRTLTLAAAAKIDPFGDRPALEEESQEIVDTTIDTADALTRLKDGGMLTAEIAAECLGVPEDQMEEFKRKFEEHKQDPFAMSRDPNADLNVDPNVDPEDPSIALRNRRPFGQADDTSSNDADAEDSTDVGTQQD